MFHSADVVTSTTVTVKTVVTGVAAGRGGLNSRVGLLAHALSLEFESSACCKNIVLAD